MISAEDLAKMLLSGTLQSSTLAALKDLSHKLGVDVGEGPTDGPSQTTGPAPSCTSGTKNATRGAAAAAAAAAAADAGAQGAGEYGYSVHVQQPGSGTPQQAAHPSVVRCPALADPSTPQPMQLGGPNSGGAVGGHCSFDNSPNDGSDSYMDEAAGGNAGDVDANGVQDGRSRAAHPQAPLSIPCQALPSPAVPMPPSGACPPLGSLKAAAKPRFAPGTPAAHAHNGVSPALFGCFSPTSPGGGVEGEGSPSASPPAIQVGGPQGAAFHNILEDVLEGIESGADSGFQDGPLPGTPAVNWSAQQLVPHNLVPQHQGGSHLHDHQHYQQQQPQHHHQQQQQQAVQAQAPAQQLQGGHLAPFHVQRGAAEDSSASTHHTSSDDATQGYAQGYSHGSGPQGGVSGTASTPQGANPAGGAPAGVQDSWEQLLEMDRLFEPCSAPETPRGAIPAIPHPAPHGVPQAQPQTVAAHQCLAQGTAQPSPLPAPFAAAPSLPTAGPTHGHSPGLRHAPSPAPAPAPGATSSHMSGSQVTAAHMSGSHLSQMTGSQSNVSDQGQGAPSHLTLPSPHLQQQQHLGAPVASPMSIPHQHQQHQYQHQHQQQYQPHHQQQHQPHHEHQHQPLHQQHHQPQQHQQHNQPQHQHQGQTQQNQHLGASTCTYTSNEPIGEGIGQSFEGHAAGAPPPLSRAMTTTGVRHAGYGNSPHSPDGDKGSGFGSPHGVPVLSRAMTTSGVRQGAGGVFEGAPVLSRTTSTTRASSNRLSLRLPPLMVPASNKPRNPASAPLVLPATPSQAPRTAHCGGNHHPAHSNTSAEMQMQLGSSGLQGPFSPSQGPAPVASGVPCACGCLAEGTPGAPAAPAPSPAAPSVAAGGCLAAATNPSGPGRMCASGMGLSVGVSNAEVPAQLQMHQQPHQHQHLQQPPPQPQHRQQTPFAAHSAPAPTLDGASLATQARATLKQATGQESDSVPQSSDSVPLNAASKSAPANAATSNPKNSNSKGATSKASKAGAKNSADSAGIAADRLTARGSDEKPPEGLGQRKSSIGRVHISEEAAAALREYKERMCARQRRGMAMDNQSVAARKRRATISHGVRKLQAVIPGGKNLDTARVLDRSVEYVMFLEQQLMSIAEGKGTHILSTFEPTQVNPLDCNGDIADDCLDF